MFVYLFSFSPFHISDQQSGNFFKKNFRVIIVDAYFLRPYKNQTGWTLAASSGPKTWVANASISHQLFLATKTYTLIVSVIILHVIIFFKLCLPTSFWVRRHPPLCSKPLFFHFNVSFIMTSLYFRLSWGCIGANFVIRSIYKCNHDQKENWALILWCLLKSYSHLFAKRVWCK